MKIALEIGHRPEEKRAYNICAMVSSRKAIGFYEKYLKITLEIGDRGGEGRAYGNLGIAHKSLGDYEKAIEYQEKHLKTAREEGDRAMEGRA